MTNSASELREHLLNYAYNGDTSRPNLGKIYKLIFDVFAILSKDTTQVRNNFFPSLSSGQALDNHLSSFSLLQFLKSDETTKRKVLRSPLYTLRQLGSRDSIYRFLDDYFSNRYVTIDIPLDAFTVGRTPIGKGYISPGGAFYIFIHNLTVDERASLYSYLDYVLPPDIEISIFSSIPAEINNKERQTYGS